jgi:dTDP-4-dehydrorhamnose reductase
MADLEPEVVIHCAARPNVDWCELHPEQARSLNFLPSLVLAEECRNSGSKLVFLSTDYVFDGSRGPYAETDATGPINVYGRLKLEAEEAIRRTSENHIIVRTTNVYGFDPDSKNFLMATLPQLARGQRVRVAVDQYGNPTTVNDLCSVVRELIENQCRGTFHVTGPDLINRAEWLRRAAQAFGLDPGLVSGVATSELEQAASRPKRSGLKTDRLHSTVSTRPADVEAGLRVMRRDWEYHQARATAAATGPAEGAVNV